MIKCGMSLGLVHNVRRRAMLGDVTVFVVVINYGAPLVYRVQFTTQERTQWLIGRVLDSRPRGRRFEPHQRHCVVVLEQDTFILA